MKDRMIFKDIFTTEIYNLLKKAHKKLLGIYEPYPNEFTHENATNWLVILRAHPSETFMQLLNSNNRVLDHVFAAYIPYNTAVNPTHAFYSENSQKLTFLECNIRFAQLEERVYSLELEEAFSDIFIYNDLSAVSELLTSIKLMESIYKPARNYVGKGRISRALAERILEDKQYARSNADIQQMYDTVYDKDHEELDTIILIDRTVDPVTPISAQKTYHGILDEALGSNTSDIEVNRINLSVVDVTGSNVKNGISLKTGFYNKLAIIDDLIPGMLPAQVNVYLSKISKTLFEEYMIYKKSASNAESGNALFQIYTMKNKYETLLLHFGLLKVVDNYLDSRINKNFSDVCEEIREVGAVKCNGFGKVEKFINMTYPVVKVLRLLCLCSLMDGGIRTDTFDQIKKLIIDVLKMLERSTTTPKIEDATRNEGLIIKKIISNFIKSDPSLKLSIDARYNSEEKLGNSQKLQSFNRFLLNDWPNKRMLGKLSNEHYFEFLNQPRTHAPTTNTPFQLDPQNPRKRKIILLVFIGGLTYTEIAAINAFSKSIGK